MIRLMTAVMLALPASARAATTLADATQLYKQGQYAGAVSAYQELLKMQPENPHLHYDLANAYFKENAAGDLGRATAEYWRAYRLLPRDADIRHNFDFALKRGGETLVPSGIPPALHWAFHCLSDRELLGLQWIGYWLFLLAGSLYLLRAESRGTLRPWLFGALAYWIFFGAWWGLRRADSVSTPGVVLEANAEVRSGPGSNFPVTVNAPEGRRVEIIARDGNWIEIGVLKEGIKGWAQTKSVEPL